jgi:phenylalanyl-tRNA synthetase beta subunit
LQLPRFPGVKQDMTIKVKADLPFAEIYEAVDKAYGANGIDDTLIDFEPAGIYQSEADQAHKNLTFRFTTTGLNRTLTDKEVANMLDAVAAELKGQIGADRV